MKRRPAFISHRLISTSKMRSKCGKTARSRVGWSRQMLPEEFQPIATENLRHIRRRVAASCQNSIELLQIGDRIESPGRLLSAEPAVEITSDRGVSRIAGELTNMVNMICDGRNRDGFSSRRRLTRTRRRPNQRQHPIVARAPDD